MIHRDVKPANLLVEASGWLWVADFGLARVCGGLDSTAGDAIRGTSRYMSPEQAVGERTLVDHRTDVYSLGVTLYELLTLRPAYEGDDRLELLRQIARVEPRAPRRIDPSIPPDLETIVLKAMAKDPAERYETAGDLADDLGRFLTHRSILARPPGVLQRTVRWARRHKSAVAMAAVLMLAASDGSRRCRRLEGGRAPKAQPRAEIDAGDRRAERVDQPQALVRLAGQAGTAGVGDRSGRVRPGSPRAAAAGAGRARPARFRMALPPPARSPRRLGPFRTRVAGLRPRPLPRRADAGLGGSGRRSLVLGPRRVAGTRRARGQRDPIHLLAFAPDGRTVASLSGPVEGPKHIKLWDLAQAREAAHIPGISGCVEAFAFSRDGRTLAAWERGSDADGSYGQVSFWDVSLGPARVSPGPPPVACTFVAVSPDHSLLATTGPSGEVTLRDASTGRAARTLSGRCPTTSGITFIPDGRSVLVLDEGGASLFDVASGREEGRIASAPGTGPSLSLDVRGFLGLPLRHGRDAWLTGPRSGLRPTTLEGVGDDNPKFVFSPDGRRLAAGGEFLRPTLWDTLSGKNAPSSPCEWGTSARWSSRPAGNR